MMLSTAMRQAMLGAIEFTGGYWVTLLTGGNRPLAKAEWVSGFDPDTLGRFKANRSLDFAVHTTGTTKWIELRKENGEFVMRSEFTAFVAPGHIVRVKSINIGIE